MSQAIKCITEFPPAGSYKYDEALWQQQHGDAFVLINCFATDIYYPEHWTPLSLKCAFRGKEYYQLGNITYAVSDQHFLVLNQGAQYASYILSDSLTESFTLNFTPYNLQVLATAESGGAGFLLDDPFTMKEGNTRFIQKLYSYSPIFMAYILQLKEQVGRTTPDTFIIQEVLYGLLKEIYTLNNFSIVESGKLPAKKRSTREELYKRLTIAKDYLHSCYGSDITLDRLGELCLLNPCYLLREFKNLYHFTPHQYLIQIRLQEAERMIAATEKPIVQIMHEIGFQDAASFSKLFKSKFGLPPLRYRLHCNS